MTTHDVAIIGGGVAGLALAYQLRARDVVVLEAAPRVGGNVRTVRRDGCTVDLGPDVMMTPSDPLLSELGLDQDLLTPNTSQVMVAHRGEVHPLPDGLVFGVPRSVAAMANTPLLTLRGKLRAACDLVMPDSHERLGLGRLVERRMGREVKEALVEPLVAGIHGGDIDELDPEVVMPPLAAAKGSLIRALSSLPKQKGSPMRAPREGMDALTEGLARGLGEKIRTSAPVRVMVRDDARQFVLETDSERIVARKVVLAVPPGAASPLVSAIDSELCLGLSGIHVRGSASVVIAFERAATMCPDPSGLLIARSEKRSVVAATWVHEKWPERVAPGLSVIRAIVRTPSLLTAHDYDLVAAVLDDLRAYGPVPDPRWAHVERFEAATPVPELGHRARVTALRERASRTNGLHFVGAAYDGSGIAGCLRGAHALAATI